MQEAIKALKVNLTVYMTPTATLVEIPAGIFAVPDLKALADWLQGHRPQAAQPVPRATSQQPVARPIGRGLVTSVRDAEGNVYPSMTAAAQATGVSLSYVSHCVRYGLHGWARTGEPGQTVRKSHGFRQEVIGPDGTVYRSKREAAIAENVSLRLMDEWLQKGLFGWKLGEKRSWLRPSVRLRAPDGREFASITEAAEAEGVTRGAFIYRIKKLGWREIDAS